MRRRNTWGRRCKKRLEKLGKSQKELADAIYYAPSHVCEVLNGRYCPDCMAAVERMLRSWEEERYYLSIGMWKE